MKKTPNPFGRLCSFDPKLIEDFSPSEPLALREQTPVSLTWVARNGNVLHLYPARFGRGPNRLLTEQFPVQTAPLPSSGWLLKREGLFLKQQAMVTFARNAGTPSNVLPNVRDFPGHFRNALHRFFRHDLDFSLTPAKAGVVEESPGGDPQWQPLKSRLFKVAAALRIPHPEVVEIPLVRLIGHGNHSIPHGDSALGGLLLAGLAFRAGGRIRVDWTHRLAVEIHRFFRRTSLFGEAFLRFILQGRTTASQERLLLAMERDLETQADLIIQEVSQAEDFPGVPFLMGVGAALEIVRADLETRHAPALPGKHRFKTLIP